jgi:hypothetical protein
MLGWKGINSEMKGCYYRASRLIKFTNEELHRFLMHQFISDNWETYKTMLNDNAVSCYDVFCKISQDYKSYLHGIENCTDEGQDEFLKMAAIFLHMSDDMFLFIQSYRADDGIAIIKGYDWFVTVWVVLNQNKYVAAFHEQLQMVLVKHKFRRYVEALRNRTVRTHPKSSGKT